MSLTPSLALLSAPACCLLPSQYSTPPHSPPPLFLLQVYMLHELEPAKELTGGPWYGPNSFDSEFITVLQEVGGCAVGGLWVGCGWAGVGLCGRGSGQQARAGGPACPLRFFLPCPATPLWRAAPLLPPPLLQATLSFITQKGDATLEDIVRFIKETVRQAGWGHRQGGGKGARHPWGQPQPCSAKEPVIVMCWALEDAPWGALLIHKAFACHRACTRASNNVNV